MSKTKASLNNVDLENIASVFNDQIGIQAKQIKESVREEINEAFRTQLPIWKEEILDEIDVKITRLKSEFYEHIDPIVKEFRDNGEERAMLSERVSDHEDRIEKLENRLDLAS